MVNWFSPKVCGSGGPFGSAAGGICTLIAIGRGLAFQLWTAVDRLHVDVRWRGKYCEAEAQSEVILQVNSYLLSNLQYIYIYIEENHLIN